MPERAVPQSGVIAAWLAAESASPRFAHTLHESSEQVTQIIQEGDAAAQFDLLVAARGNQVSKFPWAKTSWREYLITTKQELGSFRTCPGLPWLAFTEGDRLVSTAARWIELQPANLDPHNHVVGVHAELSQGKQLPPIIAYTTENGVHVLLEGHVRAMSYYLYPETAYPITILLGTPESPQDMSHYDRGLNLAEIRQDFLKETS